ncbi:helix-turn-helix domain-containing protein [Methylovirgula sp. 4M-Z18]|nr:helix-turn-helix domain-containing protein [Methylovirgula sp. 4M-Z18]
MAAAVKLRDGYSAEELRALAHRTKDVDQSRRLLSLAAVRDGMNREAAAKSGGMDRQTLRDWVYRLNAAGPDGLSTIGLQAQPRAFQWRNSRVRTDRRGRSRS